MKNSIVNGIEEGVRTLKRSLAAYEGRDYAGAFGLLSEAYDALRKQAEAAATDEGRDRMMYGDGMNFGKMYRMFESSAGSMLKSEEGRRGFSAVVEKISRDKVLRDQFRLYDAVCGGRQAQDPDAYVNEVVAMAERHSGSEVRKSNRELLEMLRRAGAAEDVYVPGSLEAVFESLGFVATNERTMDNIEEYASAKKILAEHVRDNARPAQEDVDIAGEYEKAKARILSEYDGKLTECEAAIISSVTDRESARKLFESTKGEVLEIVDRTIAGCGDDEKSKWESVRESVAEKEFSETTYLSDIAKMFKVKDAVS